MSGLIVQFGVDNLCAHTASERLICVLHVFRFLFVHLWSAELCDSLQVLSVSSVARSLCPQLFRCGLTTFYLQFGNFFCGTFEERIPTFWKCAFEGNDFINWNEWRKSWNDLNQLLALDFDSSENLETKKLLRNSVFKGTLGNCAAASGCFVWPFCV